MYIDVPDSLTCRPDVGRRSALIGHIGRYGRHQADVGSIIGTNRPYLPIWPTSGRRRQHIGTTRPYLPTWPTPGRRRQHIGANRPYLPIWPTPGRRRQHIGQIGHICRYGRHQADVGSIYIWINRLYRPIWPTSGRRRQHIGQIGHICWYGWNFWQVTN